MSIAIWVAMVTMNRARMHECWRVLEPIPMYVCATGKVCRCIDTGVRACEVIWCVSVELRVAVLAMKGVWVRAYTEI